MAGSAVERPAAPPGARKGPVGAAGNAAGPSPPAGRSPNLEGRCGASPLEGVGRDAKARPQGKAFPTNAAVNGSWMGYGWPIIFSMSPLEQNLARGQQDELGLRYRKVDGLAIVPLLHGTPAKRMATRRTRSAPTLVGLANAGGSIAKLRRT
jgi:hypothetical protein